MYQSIHRRDAEHAGRYAIQHMIARKVYTSRDDYDAIAHWAACRAGHWGRLALEDEARHGKTDEQDTSGDCDDDPGHTEG